MKETAVQSAEQLKAEAATAALAEINDWDMIVGVGSGSTVHHFIDVLDSVKKHIEATVASSEETARRLKARGFRVVELADVDKLHVYVDGADEINVRMQMIKGGGGAHTREKIVASASDRFVCIAHGSKRVDLLGKFPVAVEVLPLARSLVARNIVKLGGTPEYRSGFKTDNGNVILDVYGLDLTNPVDMERTLNNIPGVVDSGVFAAYPADVLYLAGGKGVECIVG